MGGKSLEKEVSFNSGRTICDHIDTTLYSVIPLFQTNNRIFILPWHFLHRGKITDFEHRLSDEALLITWDELKTTVDFIYIAQHGRYAEDGILQGTLEVLGIPYLGSGILASALRMDKITQKTFLKNAGIFIPRSIVIEPHEVDNFKRHEPLIMQRLIDAGIDNTYVIKPHNEGSSIGISLACHDTLEAALQKACSIEPGRKKRILIEEKLEGMEFTCIILTDPLTGSYIPLPPTEIVPEPETAFFDYEQKYMPGRGTKYTPARCDDVMIQQIQTTCINVMKTLNFTNMSRIDGFVTRDNRIVIIDPNTLSGMAPSSFIFNQAAEIDMSPTDIINHIIKTDLHRYNIQNYSHSTNKCDNMTEKKRIAVLLGGRSNEKETSLESGRNIFYKLNRNTYEIIPLFVNEHLELYHLTSPQIVRNSTEEISQLLDSTQKISWNSLPDLVDFVFIALHGGEGENGAIQGMLEMLGLPYNGSGVLTSALCMNKYKTNEFLAAQRFDVPQNLYITKEEWLCNTDLQHLELIKNIEKGLIVKPYDDGCSVMVQKITSYKELTIAIDAILQKKDAVLIEEYIVGTELTGGVIGNRHATALPPSQTIAQNGILTIEEKFLPGAGENQTPALLPEAAICLIQRTLEQVYTIIQCKGYARIDCFYQTAEQSPTGKERVIILEINTLPGLTPATCLFHQAAEIQLRPSEFLDMIITLGFEEHGYQSENTVTKPTQTLSVLQQ